MKSIYFLVFVMAAACLNACGHELLETEIDDGCKLHTVKCNGLTKFVCVANDEINELCSEADDILTCQSEKYTGKTRWKLSQEPCECFDGQVSYRNVEDENGNELCHEFNCSFGKFDDKPVLVDGNSCLYVESKFQPGGRCINNESSCTGNKLSICVNGLYKEIECEGCRENTEDGVYSCTVKSCENENKPFCSDDLLKTCESSGEADDASFQITITPCRDGCVPGNEEHEAFCYTTADRCKDGDVDSTNNKICQNGEWIVCSLGMMNQSECRECLDGNVICDGNSLKICEDGHWSVHQCADQCVSNSTENASGSKMCVESVSECEENAVVCDNGMLKKCEGSHWTYIKCSKGCIDNDKASYCKECDDTDEPKCIDNPDIKTVDISENNKGKIGIDSDSESKGNTVQICNGGRWDKKQCKSGCYGSFNEDGNGSVTCIDAKGDSKDKVCSSVAGQAAMCISDEKKHVTCIDEDDEINYYATTYCQIGCYSTGDSVGCGVCQNGEKKCQDNKILKCENGQWNSTDEDCEPCEAGKTKCEADSYFMCDENGWRIQSCDGMGCDSNGCLECTGNETKCESGRLFTCNNGHWEEGMICPLGCDDVQCRVCDADEYPKCDENNSNKLTCDDGLDVKEEPCENGCLNGECRECKDDGDKKCEGGYYDVCRDGKWKKTQETCEKCDNSTSECRSDGNFYQCMENNWRMTDCNGFGCYSNGCNECGANDTQECRDDGIVGQYKVCKDHFWGGEQKCNNEYSCNADGSGCGVCQNNTQKCEDGMEFRCNGGGWVENKLCGEGLGCLNGIKCRDCNKPVCADNKFKDCKEGTWGEEVICQNGCATNGNSCNKTAECQYGKYACIQTILNQCSGNDYEPLNVTQYCDDATNKTYICSDSGIKIIDCSPSGCDENHSNCKDEPCITSNSKCINGNYYYCENSQWLSLPFAKECCFNNEVRSDGEFYQPSYCDKEGNNCSPSQDHCFSISCSDGYASSPNDNNYSCKQDNGKYSYGECQNGIFTLHENGTHINLCFNGRNGLFVQCPDGFTRNSFINNSKINLFLTSDPVCMPLFSNNMVYCHNVYNYYTDVEGVVGVMSNNVRCEVDDNPVSCHYYLENDNSVLKSECGKCLNYEISGRQICINGEWVDDWILNKNN